MLQQFRDKQEQDELKKSENLQKVNQIKAVKDQQLVEALTKRSNENARKQQNDQFAFNQLQSIAEKEREHNRIKRNAKREKEIEISNQNEILLLSKH